ITPTSATNALPGETDHTFTVHLTKGGKPLAGYTVAVSSNFGGLDRDSAQTDALGAATFVVSSAAPGTATLSASATLSLPDRTLFTAPNLQPLGRMDSVVHTLTATATKTWLPTPELKIVKKTNGELATDPNDADVPQVK